MTKKTEEYEWFCPQPFMNIVTDVFGKIKPCCVIKYNVHWDRNQTIEEYSKSDKLKQFRKEMLEGGGPTVKSNCEVCLIGVKGKPLIINNSISSALLSDREKHSKKPDIVRDNIVKLCGDLPRIELFARERINGWDSWGNEL